MFVVKWKTQSFDFVLKFLFFSIAYKCKMVAFKTLKKNLQSLVVKSLSWYVTLLSLFKIYKINFLLYDPQQIKIFPREPETKVSSLKSKCFSIFWRIFSSIKNAIWYNFVWKQHIAFKLKFINHFTSICFFSWYPGRYVPFEGGSFSLAKQTDSYTNTHTNLRLLELRAAESH